MGLAIYYTHGHIPEGYTARGGMALCLTDAVEWFNVRNVLSINELGVKVLPVSVVSTANKHWGGD